MRFIFELSPTVGRLIGEAMEQGVYPSVDELAADAITRLLGPGVGSEKARSNGISSYSPPNRVGTIGAPTADRSDNAPWVWGMVNRVFPLKLVARVCATLSRDGGLSLNVAYRACADAAAQLAPRLTNDDLKASRRRNESRAVSLPSGPELDKSKVRFAQQFVGRRDANRGFGGGAFDLGILGIDEATALIAPTDLGWQFAMLRNPVLDETWLGVGNLSEEEKDFFLFSIVPSIPAERHAASTILRALALGPLSPDALGRSVFPRTSPGSSTVVANTARAGAFGRLLDVGAVSREPQGRSAILEITEKGKQTLALLEGTANVARV